MDPSYGQDHGNHECRCAFDPHPAPEHESCDAVEHDIVAPVETILQELTRADGQRPAALDSGEHENAGRNRPHHALIGVALWGKRPHGKAGAQRAISHEWSSSSGL